MSKEIHDIEAAKIRPISYEKIWFRQAAHLLNQVQLKGGSALDLCCGNAEFSEILRDQFEMQVSCVEYVSTYVENAQAKGFKAFKVDLEHDNLTQTPFFTNHREHFDLVVLLEAIEHIFDTNELLNFIHSVLKPGGYLLISTPNISFWGYRLYSLVSGNVPFAEGHHIRFFDEQRLREFLYLTGFAGDKIQTANYLSSIPIDRICTQRSRIPIWFGRAINFTFTRTFFHMLLPRQLRESGLVVLARREDVPTLALSWQRCETMLSQAQGTTYDAMRQRLKSAQILGFMREHPLLNAFVNALE